MFDFAAMVFTTSSLRPKFNMVSIIPGIEARAPERTDLKALAHQFKAEYKKQLGKDFPNDPKEQLFEAVKAVFRSCVNSISCISR